MRIYVASSWRNTRQSSVVAALRAAGHEVYDFREHGFGWRECLRQECCTPECGGVWGTGCDHCHFSTCQCFAPLRDPRRFRDEVLSHPIARAGYDRDMKALLNADVTVLVLPCGRSAHLELGIVAGAGQKTVVLLDDPLSEPELMYLACTKLCVSVGEVLETLQESVAASPVATMTYGQLVEGLRTALRNELLRRLGAPAHATPKPNQTHCACCKRLWTPPNECETCRGRPPGM